MMIATQKNSFKRLPPIQAQRSREGRGGSFRQGLNFLTDQRDLVLSELGLSVLRIRNEELVDMDEVIGKILAFVKDV